MIRRPPRYDPNPDAPLWALAALERAQPGRLASWLRAQRPAPEPARDRVGACVSVKVLRPQPSKEK